MSTYDATGNATRRPFSGRRVRPGDLILQGVAGAAALGAVVLVGLIAYKVIEGSRLSFSTFGLGFLTTTTWDPVHNQFGAANLIFGTIVTSIGALILATPLALGVALFLTELAPGWIRGPVTALVETLAAIPSVVIGLWGIIVLGPVLRDDVMPRAALGARLHPDLRAVDHRLDHLHGDRRADDHDPADHLEHLARALSRRAE